MVEAPYNARVDDLLRATARAEERHFWFRGFRWFVAPIVRRALAGAGRVRILDCGCGTGANLTVLERFGDAYGFDISPVGLEIGRTLGRPRLVRASVTAAPFPSQAFDLVTSFDVIYALDEEDARRALAEMFRLTRPGGRIVINVAAMNVLRGDHSVLSRERRRYDRAGLSRAVTEAGFTIERITYTNATLFLPLLARRAMQRSRGLAREADADREIAVPIAPLNGILSAALFVESLWLRWFDSPFGSSLLCLARKPSRT
jgi:SAM-dependent methyltransferase